LLIANERGATQRRTKSAPSLMKTPLLLFLLLLLGGCSLFRSQQPIDTALSWPEQREKNRRLEQFQISGKIGIRAPRESGSANLFWQQSQDYFDIRLAGPLGRGAARLVGSPKEARLEAADVTASGNAEQLLAERLGWTLPLKALTWWLRGLPMPGQSAKLQLNIDNRLVQLNQQGWRIDYLSYDPQQGYWLPTRLKIKGHNLAVTVVIKDWDVSPTPLPEPLSHKWERGAKPRSPSLNEKGQIPPPRPLAGEGLGERVARSTMSQKSH